MYKKDCAISLPTGFIFVHCRLVSQCNAPPITSHSFAPTPHPSRPSAHAPNTLWRQSLLRGGVRFCHPRSTSYPPPLPPSLPAPSCLCWLPSPCFISSTGYHSPERLTCPDHCFSFFSLSFLWEAVMHQKCYSNRVLRKCYNSVTPPLHPPSSLPSFSHSFPLYFALHLLLFPLLTSTLSNLQSGEVQLCMVGGVT